MAKKESSRGPASAFESETFGQDGSFILDKPVGSASISPCGRDVVLASQQGLHIIDLDSPYSPPRHLPHHTPWEVADVQWSPFAARDYWVVSTSNQKALVWNLMSNTRSSVEHVLHAHTRAITDINFSAHMPDVLATCAVDSFVHCWDLRHPSRPAMTFCDWLAAASQVKWNRQDSHILASSHDKILRIWDDRKGAYPLRSIEAHATKIYGVDWSRTDTANLVTCSLDRTIKFWDYTSESHEPSRVLHTPFPVWRARHTPFGHGLLAMPQRGNHDLHLYDHRPRDKEDQGSLVSATYKFGGHNNQVKEFLWRPRGTITESIDDRDFQLVSWGTDRILRLHQVEDDVLRQVGYEKGVQSKRHMNFTRRNAVYKTFRDDPPTFAEYGPKELMENPGISNRLPSIRAQSTLTVGISRVPVPFAGGYGNGGFMSPAAGGKAAALKDMDPISWMRGVKIGKRETSPSGLHQSVSSILSPSLKTEPTWDKFETLGEEITHVADKFTKVSFNEIDMHCRRILISLVGPWGSEKGPTNVKARIEFPSAYPESTAPKVSLEKIASLNEEIIGKLSSDVSVITEAYLSNRRSSFEALLRFLLGEQDVEESIRWLKKGRESVDLDFIMGVDLSSSEDDDDGIDSHTGPIADGVETIDPTNMRPKAQNNPPLPKACGALWADDGRLVCFFPHKQEKEPSLFDLTLGSHERLSRRGKSIFDGFGRFYNRSAQKSQAPSTLETIVSGDSDEEATFSSSSTSSSASDGVVLPRHHFIPNMAWRGGAPEALPGNPLDESQRSNSDIERSRSSASRKKNFVSVHDFNSLLPANKYLAQNYLAGHHSTALISNATTARTAGNMDLADTWLFVDLILQHQVPLEIMSKAQDINFRRDTDVHSSKPILIIARHAISGLKSKDSALDLSFDEEQDSLTNELVPVEWGRHPCGQRHLIDALFRHYEQLADVQTLAMLSCAFAEIEDPWNAEDFTTPSFSTSKSKGSDVTPIRREFGMRNYYPSWEVAKAHLELGLPNASLDANTQNGAGSTISSTGQASSDLSASITPPSAYRSLLTNIERGEPMVTTLSTSPEDLRNQHRSISNLSVSGGSLSRTISSTTSVASSPPNIASCKRSSPAGSYLGASIPNIACNPSQPTARWYLLGDTRSSLSTSDSVAGTDQGQAKESPFTVKLKNQYSFHNDGYSHVPLLDPRQAWRHYAYRKAYAHLLYVWGFQMARSEILKYNITATLEPTASSQSIATCLSIENANYVSEASPFEDDRLGMRDRCRSCTTLLSSTLSSARCQECSTSVTRLTCLLCRTFIRGLSSSCLNCGHVLHMSCRELLLSQPREEVQPECLSGCGCICGDHTSFRVEKPDQLAEFSRKEESPAPTAVGDPINSEQEQLSWYDNSEWEDMAAYESLARNLKPKQVKPRSSQIWRGRKSSA